MQLTIVGVDHGVLEELHDGELTEALDLLAQSKSLDDRKHKDVEAAECYHREVCGHAVSVKSGGVRCFAPRTRCIDVAACREADQDQCSARQSGGLPDVNRDSRHVSKCG